LSKYFKDRLLFAVCQFKDAWHLKPDNFEELFEFLAFNRAKDMINSIYMSKGSKDNDKE
jgi:hypothetical protein